MLLRIIKTVTLPNVGTFKPGMVANIPREAAQSWINDGKAMVYDGKPWKAAPEARVIPKGMFWCEKHQCLHKLDSGPGKACQRRLEKEAAVQEAEKAAAAEEKAKSIAESAARGTEEKTEEEAVGGKTEEEEESSESED